MSSGYSTYARTDIQTADPRMLIVLLYEGVLNYLTQAKLALDDGNRTAMSQNISFANKIIHHLSNGLDFENGGEVAENLARLYDYMRDTLQMANIKADGQKIDEVAGLIKPLLEAWRQVAQDPEAAQALQSRPAPARIVEVIDPRADANLNPDATPQVSSSKESLAETIASHKPSPAARAAYGLH